MESYKDFIIHSGVKGMSWGVRNEDTLRKYGLLSNTNTRAVKSEKVSKDKLESGRILSGGGDTGDDEWDNLPEDPNEPRFIVRNGIKIYKAEDGTAYAYGPNGERIDADNPARIFNLYKNLADPGKQKERFSQLSEDPNSRDYVKIQGYDVRKAEDGTAYITDTHGKNHFGDTPGEAIKSVRKTELIDKVKDKVSQSEDRKYQARLRAGWTQEDIKRGHR